MSGHKPILCCSCKEPATVRVLRGKYKGMRFCYEHADSIAGLTPAEIAAVKREAKRAPHEFKSAFREATTSLNDLKIIATTPQERLVDDILLSVMMPMKTKEN